MPKQKLRAEAWGVVHERELGARLYTHALATKREDGSVEIRSYSTQPKPAEEWLLSFYGRRPEGIVEARVVPVTVRTLPERSEKAKAASALAGRRRQVQNEVTSAIWWLKSYDWAEYEERFGSERASRCADDAVKGIVQAYRRLAEVGLR